MAAKKIPPRVTKLRDLKKYLSQYGIKFGPGGKHPRFENASGVKYPIPLKDELEREYVDALRRKFGLTEEDGVSNEDFYKK
jgi:hypothetical protein